MPYLFAVMTSPMVMRSSTSNSTAGASHPMRPRRRADSAEHPLLIFFMALATLLVVAAAALEASAPAHAADGPAAPSLAWIDRDRSYNPETTAKHSQQPPDEEEDAASTALASWGEQEEGGAEEEEEEEERCEIVWVRCRESLNRWVLHDLPAMGYRVNVVEKCESRPVDAKAGAPPFFYNSLFVPNVGDEGYGYLAWIVSRWYTLPRCAM
jgi:hypothetical protein